MTAHIIFDVQELYYLTQYLPVCREMLRRQARCTFVIYQNPDFNPQFEKAIRQEGLSAHWVKNDSEALEYYLTQKADWVFFGNHFSGIDRLHKVSQSAQLGHGVGPKMSYYTKSGTPMTVRFIEGDRRYEVIRKMYPESTFVQTGFAKLDPLVNGEIPPLDLEAAGLDPRKKTLLYAPTFYPSSLECFADSWPEEFSGYNLIVKPHFFSLTKPKYRAQQKKLARWAKAPNTYVAGVDEHSLLPFMAAADLLISEASSALFEFAALGKPIVWCDFLKLRWTYRGPLSYRFKKRMDQDMLNFADLGAHAARYRDLGKVVAQELATPKTFAEKRKAYTAQLVGTVDGKASQRIADYLTDHLNRNQANN